MRRFDPEEFLRIRDRVVSGDRDTGGIGTLGEKTMHAVLKAYYEPLGALHEQKLGRYVADILNEDGVLEIQTRSLSKMKEKLYAFTAVTRVTVIHPVVRKKWLVWLDPGTGEVSQKRKSPKTGNIYDAFWELQFLGELLSSPELTVCLPLLDIEETRLKNGWGNGGKRGSERMDRYPTQLVSETVLASRGDWLALIPDTLDETFTRKELAKAVGQPAEAGAWISRVFLDAGVIVRDGVRGREFLYRRVQTL